MSVFQITFIIISSSVLLHTRSADDEFSAVMPKTVTALTGSCVQIPCTFDISNFEDKRSKTKSFYGIWLKKIPQFRRNNSFIVFNSSKNIIRGFSKVQMTGNLTERNCTTVFYNIMMNHSDPYYFRLEMNPNVFRATFNTPKTSSKTVNITVTDLPKPPELQPKNLSYVMEGSTVNLSCSAEAPCPKQPPTISWSNISESANITTQLLENPDKTQSVFSNMTFKASYRDHGKNISCTVTYPRKTSEDSTVEATVTLRVLFPPKETNITIDSSASISVGTNVTLNCKSKGSPSNMTYTWYKREQKRPIAQGKNFTFIVSQSNGWYSCTAQNKVGYQSAEIQLTAEGQYGVSKHMIVACIGGTAAVLMLSAVGFYTRITKKTNSGDNAGEKDSLNQVQDGATDMNSTYENVLTVINQVNKISDVQSVSKTEHRTEKDLTEEDNNETGSDVVYAQVHVLHIKTKAMDVQHDAIYAQVKK